MISHNTTSGGLLCDDSHSGPGSPFHVTTFTLTYQVGEEFTRKFLSLDQRIPLADGETQHFQGIVPCLIMKVARVFINVIVMGSGIMGRALLQAYRKALENANKTGVAHETLQNVHRASKAMTQQEARQILGISEQSTWEEILQKYDASFERNSKNGSFYLQSKVHRAKECLEPLYQGKGE